MRAPRFRWQTSAALSLIGALAASTGCSTAISGRLTADNFGQRPYSASSRVTAPGAPRAWPMIGPNVRAARSAIGFISDATHSTLYVVNAAGQITGMLAGLENTDGTPLGLAVDKNGNLYVADERLALVQVYAPPYNESPTILHDPGESPSDVAVDRKGNTAACNDGELQGSPSVSFYAKGVTNPTSTLVAPTPPFVTVYSCAFDSGGNLYLTGAALGNFPLVGEIVGGASGTSITSLTLTDEDASELQNPTGIQITTSGLLAIAADAPRLGAAIYVFQPPTGGVLGDPVGTTFLQYAIQRFAFTPGNDRALLAGGAASVIGYPDGNPIETIDLPGSAYAAGAAINPTESY